MENTARDDEFFMRLALDEAMRALERGEVPIGAVVVAGVGGSSGGGAGVGMGAGAGGGMCSGTGGGSGGGSGTGSAGGSRMGTVIGRGHNLVETLIDPTAHAEMQAITAATSALGGKYLTDCTLYATIEPCPMCAAALGWAQLGRLVYGADDPKRGFTNYHTCGKDGRRQGLNEVSARRSGGRLADELASKFDLLHVKTTVTKGVLADECGRLVADFFRNRRK